MAKRNDKGARRRRQRPWDYARAAAFLGIHPGTLRNWLWAGVDIPNRKIGGRVYFSRVALERWLASRERIGSRFVSAAATTTTGADARA